MPRDHYEVLGVPRTASLDEIKKAFRKKAHELHPDKHGGDEARFKELNEAYQVLSDSQKRSAYDRFGHAGPRMAGGQGSPFAGGNVNFNVGDMGGFGDFGEVFEQFFGGRQRAGSRGQRQRRGRDVELELAVDFLESARGASRDVEVRVASRCERCDGTGGEPGSTRERCATCRGSGAVEQAQETFFGTFRSSQLCPACQGEGTVVSKQCSACRGAGRTERTRQVAVKVPAGIADGQTLRLSGLGEAGERGAPSGDVYVTVRVRPHPQLRREGDDVHGTLKLGVKQAALGATVTVPTLDGDVDLKVPAGTQPGTVLRLAGRGMPHLGGRGRGNHLVTVEVAVPAKLSREQRRALEELF